MLESDVGLRRKPSRKFSSKPLSANIQNEHGLVGQLLIEVIGPRFSAEVLSGSIFHGSLLSVAH